MNKIVSYCVGIFHDVDCVGISRQIPITGSKEEEREVANSGVGSEHDGLVAPPTSTWLMAEDDGKYASKSAHDR